MNIDISVVITLHRDGKYLMRTLQSLRDAAAYAREFGISTELVAVLDCPDQKTAEILARFDLAAFDGHQVIHVNNGSEGLSRNDGAATAKGRYVQICGGRDLISYNYLVAMYRSAEHDGQSKAFFPNYLIGYGAKYSVVEYFNLGNLTPLALLQMHPFVSQVFAHRDLFARQKYSDVKSSDKYAPADWHFHCELVSLGYELAVSEDAILFCRQHCGTQPDGSSTHVIPPSRLFIPDIYIDTCDVAYQNLANAEGTQVNLRSKGRNIVIDPVGFELIAAANAIEPAIEPGRIAKCETYTNVTYLNLDVGKAYYEICRQLGSVTFTDVFVLPYFGGGGAELYALKIMHELLAQKRSENILVIFGEQTERHVWLDQLPASVMIVDIGSYWHRLNFAERDLLVIKIIQSSAPGARVHFRQSQIGERLFSQYKGTLQKTNHCVYYRFGNMMRNEGSYQINMPEGFDFFSESFEFFSTIIADNETIIRSDQTRLGTGYEKWECLRVSHSPKIERETAIAKTLLSGPNILWASRLASEKRLSLLPKIAELLYLERPEVRIFVYGTDAHGHFDPQTITKFRNVSFEGPFSNFDEIATSDYSCFFYTSWFDGMPNVVLEAISAGLPVIAPDVGGIGEVIVDGLTGVLLASTPDDEIMARAYVDAILKLIDNPQLRARYVGESLDLMVEQRSPEIFARRIAEIFEPIYKLTVMESENQPAQVKTSPASTVSNEMAWIVAKLERQLAEARRHAILDKEELRKARIENDLLNVKIVSPTSKFEALQSGMNRDQSANESWFSLLTKFLFRS